MLPISKIAKSFGQKCDWDMSLQHFYTSLTVEVVGILNRTKVTR